MCVRVNFSKSVAPTLLYDGRDNFLITFAGCVGTKFARFEVRKLPVFSFFFCH